MIQTMISQMQPQLDGALLGDAVVCESAMPQQLSILEHKALSVGWDAASVANRWCQWVEILELSMMLMMMQNTRQTTQQDPHEPCCVLNPWAHRLQRISRFDLESHGIPRQCLDEDQHDTASERERERERERRNSERDSALRAIRFVTSSRSRLVYQRGRLRKRDGLRSFYARSPLLPSQCSLSLFSRSLALLFLSRSLVALLPCLEEEYISLSRARVHSSLVRIPREGLENLLVDHVVVALRCVVGVWRFDFEREWRTRLLASRREASRSRTARSASCISSAARRSTSTRGSPCRARRSSPTRMPR